MGVVYLANDPEIERPVAIKMLREASGVSLTARSDLEARFLKEAKLAGRLQHPNVVTVYEVGREQDASFIAMEYVEGEPLNRAAAAEGGLDLGTRVEIVRQVAQALEHAHQRGVIHRDIKPGNILVTRDRRVKVADFGIGKLLSGGTADLTRTGQMLGSPAYMSPEQIRGEKLDGRSDLFSLGVVFYELLTGARPFPGDSITTLVYQILHTEPRDPLELRADLPAATRDMFARLLAKTPDRRPANATAFLQEVRGIEAELAAIQPTQAITALQSGAPAASAGSHSTPSAPGGAPPEMGPAAEPLVRTGAPTSRGGPLYLFGAAAILVALSLFLWIWRGSFRRAEQVSAARTPAARPVSPETAAAPLPEPTAPAPPTPEATPQPLPSAGPSTAADAVVGATRLESTAVPRPRPSPSPRPAATAAPRPTEAPPPVLQAAAPGDSSAAASLPPADNVYRTRRFARFTSSPDQARLYVDGRYAGIADDWDDRGGGKTLPFSGDGTHRVRLELPGYRTLRLDVLVTPNADDDTVEIDDELKRLTRVEYPKLKGPSGRTVGPVEFQVAPPDATVSENGKPLGKASSFGPGSPLELTGPTVHDLTLSAPGYDPRSVRILVSSNADRDRATVRAVLKPLPKP